MAREPGPALGVASLSAVAVPSSTAPQAWNRRVKGGAEFICPEIRNFRSPFFRFGREAYAGEGIPDFRLGIGNGEIARFPIGRKSGNGGYPAGVSAAAMILGWMLH